jgi:hypothetical protein
VKKRIGSYPGVRIEGGGRAVVSQAGGVLLVETVRETGLECSPAGRLVRPPVKKTGLVPPEKSRRLLEAHAGDYCCAVAPRNDHDSIAPS